MTSSFNATQSWVRHGSSLQRRDRTARWTRKQRGWSKLAIAIGAMREGAVHASARKALAQGVSKDEMYQIVALAAGTLGLPSTVAVYTWIEDVLEPNS